MEDYFDEELDALFKQAADHYQINYDPKQWLLMQEKLRPKEPENKGVAFFKIWLKPYTNMNQLKETQGIIGFSNLFTSSNN